MITLELTPKEYECLGWVFTLGANIMIQNLNVASLRDIPEFESLLLKIAKADPTSSLKDVVTFIERGR